MMKKLPLKEPTWSLRLRVNDWLVSSGFLWHRLLPRSVQGSVFMAAAAFSLVHLLKFIVCTSVILRPVIYQP